MQDIVGQCPFTGWNVIVFQGSSSSSWGVARNVHNKSASYNYLASDLTWHGGNLRGLTKDEAYELARRWMAWAEGNKESIHLPPSNNCNGDPVETIVPLLLDKTRMRVQFKCPKCGKEHKTQIKSDKWNEIVEFIKRKCPREGESGAEFQIRLWKGDRNTPACALGDIDPLPKYECTECWGSGEYVGFTSVQPCAQCFPKPKADADALKNYKSTSFP